MIRRTRSEKGRLLLRLDDGRHSPARRTVRDELPLAVGARPVVRRADLRVAARATSFTPLRNVLRVPHFGQSTREMRPCFVTDATTCPRSPPHTEHNFSTRLPTAYACFSINPPDNQTAEFVDKKKPPASYPRRRLLEKESPDFAGD